MRSLAFRLTGVAVPAGVVLGVAALPAEAKSRPAHQLTAVATGPTDAPSGQTTVAAPLPAAATTFGSGVGGWVAGRMSLAWTKAVGHTAPGALAVTTAGDRSAVASPTFAVTPGARYSADAWTLAAAVGHNVGLALRFYAADGSQIAAGTQTGEAVTDVPAVWTKTHTVVGFAPANAATAQVLVLSMDSLLNLVDYVDDVSVTKTTGVASPVAGPLTTSGPDILDAQGHRVQLHGIQLGGLRNAGWSNATISTEEIDAAHRWGANFARVPLSENPIVPGDCSYDASYIAIVDRIVTDLTSRGMVALLDLHTNAVTECGDYTQQQKLPDTKSVAFWQFMANRYKSNPLVAFDLYNEPHDVSDSVWRNGGTVTSGGATYTAVGMQQLYNTVRATGAANLVFASGNGWANNYPALAPLSGTTNLVWGVHAYTCHATNQPCSSGPLGVMDPSNILGHFATIGLTQPVIITEFGFPDAQTGGEYITNAANYAASHGWAGWNVFVFDGTAVDPFDLLKDVDTLWDPEPAGMAVITGMLND